MKWQQNNVKNNSGPVIINHYEFHYHERGHEIVKKKSGILNMISRVFKWLVSKAKTAIAALPIFS